jgi:transposase-like protein
MDALKTPKTLQEAIAYFSDTDRCFEYAKRYRWPSGEITCPRCQKAKHSFIKTRKIWFCYVCKKQFTLKVGTIMEDSPISLDKWMAAFWMLSNCKNGISSYELGKAIGVHQESAWFMLQRIRKVMQDDFYGSKLGGGGGEVEVDESFIGGKARNMHLSERKRRITGTGTKDKTAVTGILERGGKIRTTVVPNRKKHALQSEVRKHVEAWRGSLFRCSAFV